MGSVARAGDSTAARVPNVLAKILLLVARGVVVILLNVTQHAPAVAAWRPWPHLYLNTTSATVGGLGFGARATDSDLDLGASKKFEGSSEFVQLRYHMGPVLTANITVHPIWYGRQWSRAQKRIIRSFLRSISPSSSGVPPRRPSVAAWWRTVRLYTDQTGANISAAVALGAEKSDRRLSRAPPCPGWTFRGHPRRRDGEDPAPPREREGGPLPRAHLPRRRRGGLLRAGVRVPLLHLPVHRGLRAAVRVGGQLGGALPGGVRLPVRGAQLRARGAGGAGPNGDVGVDGMVSVVAHELAEMASNPLVNAWYAGADPCFPTEIADLCEASTAPRRRSLHRTAAPRPPHRRRLQRQRGRGRRFLVQWI
ncbi:Protein EXORDIUM-like 3 [Ananas comosus]|uniref:Protein EXORDIUM-like 3 n=1 Tax=Ananas comosus TaxID=4615 RepID=A0A199VX88_ANACO|nr:Protein EXORDIUM-like 3 [Ananas comosus]